jgi:hypothetical protein
MFFNVGFIVLIIALQNCGGIRHEHSDNVKARTVIESKDDRVETDRKGENKMESVEERGFPKLDVSIENTGSSLVLEYKIKNTTGKPIFLFNVLFEWDNQGTPLGITDSVYACLRKDGTLHLAKQILPLPAHKMVEVRRIPYTTRLEVNEEFREKVNIKIPVEEYNPYFYKKADSAVEPRTAESAFFTIQFIRNSDMLEVTKTMIPNAFAVDHPDLFAAVETIDSKPIPITVKVNKRIDTFEEF